MVFVLSILIFNLILVAPPIWGPYGPEFHIVLIIRTKYRTIVRMLKHLSDNLCYQRYEQSTVVEARSFQKLLSLHSIREESISKVFGRRTHMINKILRKIILTYIKKQFDHKNELVIIIIEIQYLSRPAVVIGISIAYCSSNCSYNYDTNNLYHCWRIWNKINIGKSKFLIFYFLQIMGLCYSLVYCILICYPRSIILVIIFILLLYI